MGQLLALSTSIAVLGAVWVFLALNPLSGLVLVWAGFIAWGCFFHNGGDMTALKKTIAGNVYGALLALIALILVVNNPVGLPGTIAAPIYVGITVFPLVFIATVPLLSAVPANVYGYAALVGYSLHQAPGADGVGPLQSLTSASFANPFILLSVSYILGALFGLASGKLAGALTKKS